MVKVIQKRSVIGSIGSHYYQKQFLSGPFHLQSWITRSTVASVFQPFTSSIMLPKTVVNIFPIDQDMVV